MAIPLPTNPNDVSRVSPQLPAETYRVRIAGAEDDGHKPKVLRGKKDPSQMFLKVRLEILGTADGREVVIARNTGDEMSCIGKTLFATVFLNEKEFNVRQLRQLLECFGLNPNLPEGLPDDGDGSTISEWVGLEGTVQTAVGKDGYLEVARDGFLLPA